MIDEDRPAATERTATRVLSGEMPKSVLYVPLCAGGRATGVISLQNLDREHAFTDSDQQLLETLARSLSVALENARLVHETRQRNAELALINSVQEAIAGELDPQAIYESSATRSRRSSTPRSLTSASSISRPRAHRLPVCRSSAASASQGVPSGRLTASALLETSEPF